MTVYIFTVMQLTVLMLCAPFNIVQPLNDCDPNVVKDLQMQIKAAQYRGSVTRKKKKTKQNKE